MTQPEYDSYRRGWEADVGQRLTLHSERLIKLETEMAAIRVAMNTLEEVRKDVKSITTQLAYWGGAIAFMVALVEAVTRFVK